MYASELIAKIQDGINNPSVISTDILVEINRKIKEITAEVKIPDLIDEDGDTVTFSAGSHYADMPDDYEPKHGILYAYSVTNSLDLIVRSNSKVLYKDRDRTTTGSITEVAPDGKMLFCFDGSAAKDVVRVKFYAKPDDLVYSSIKDDEPDYFPSHLHEGLLVDGVVFDLLKFRRYGEDEKMDADRDREIKKECAARHEIAIEKLRKIYPEPPKPKLELRRQVRTF